MSPKLLITRLAVFIIITAFTSCKDLIEPSISNRQITANAPGEKYQSTNYNVSFWWDDVEDALQYRLQVVTPKFDSAATLVIDTVVKTTKFAINLTPGIYQWRVRAENGSSQTQYSSVKSFSILYSSLKEQKEQIISPTNNLLTNQSTITFSWGTLYGATNYHIQIDTSNFADEKNVYYDKVVPGQQLAITLKTDKAYQWRVRAENDTAQSQWSSVNYFTYDHTPPDAVTLSLPTNQQSVSSPVSIQWSASPDAVKYRLFLYKSDGTTLYSSSFPLSLTTTSYSFTSGSSGDIIYWKVTAIDAAGNESAASEVRSFSIQ